MPKMGEYPGASVVEKYFAVLQKRNDHPMIGGSHLGKEGCQPGCRNFKVGTHVNTANSFPAF